MREPVFGADVENMTIRQINKLFRDHDESHLWPISGEFNATERAIRYAREIRKANGEMGGLEYAETLENIISQIVNDERNW